MKYPRFDRGIFIAKMGFLKTGYLLHGEEIAYGVPLGFCGSYVLRVAQYSAEAKCLKACYAAAEWIPLRF